MTRHISTDFDEFFTDHKPIAYCQSFVIYCCVLEIGREGQI